MPRDTCPETGFQLRVMPDPLTPEPLQPIEGVTPDCPDTVTHPEALRYDPERDGERDGVNDGVSDGERDGLSDPDMVNPVFENGVTDTLLKDVPDAERPDRPLERPVRKDPTVPDLERLDLILER